MEDRHGDITDTARSGTPSLVARSNRVLAELTEMLGHRVDLVSRRAIERSPNWIRRRAILESAEAVYVAG